MTGEAVEVSGLVINRGIKRAVDNVSLTLMPGRITALLGPNGAGKSSLVLGIAGVIPPSAGTIRIGTTPTTGLGPDRVRALGIAAVPEGHRTLATLNVDDNLLAAGPMLGAGDLKSSVAEAYAVFPELAERKGQIAGSMSGGQQQMLALAQALVARPKFILADEMSFGLAPIVVRRLMQVVQKLAAKGTGVLLIEQFTQVALSLAHVAHVMSQGKLTFSGETALLQANPDILHRAYLGSA